MLRMFLLTLLLMVGLGTHAENSWFTVLGDAQDPNVTTIEVDPVPVAVYGEFRTMRVRVNRPVLRATREGTVFRSFTSKVLFDCSKKTARYISVDFYMQALWQGESYKSENYPASDLRAMEFREVNPNPRDRIIRAACRTTGTAS